MSASNLTTYRDKDPRDLGVDEIHKRDRDAYGLWAKGTRKSTVADTFKISEAEVDVILDRVRRAGRLAQSNDPIRIVDEVIERTESDIEDLAIIQATAADPRTRISAIKAKDELRSRQVGLLQESGRLPKKLGQMEVIQDVRTVSIQIAAIIDDPAIPAHIKEKFHELFATAGVNEDQIATFEPKGMLPAVKTYIDDEEDDEEYGGDPVLEPASSDSPWGAGGEPEADEAEFEVVHEDESSKIA